MQIFLTCMLLLAPVLVAANDKSSQLDQLMQRYHEMGQFNGVALVIDAGSTMLRKGYGFANREWQISNTPETRFLVGSMTKSFTAIVIVRLVEQGKLDLDATISEQLPSYRADTGKIITLRHLLTHTDGIPNYTRDTYFWQSYENGVPYTTSEFIARYCSGNPEFKPGSQYRYGNAGYSILGAIIEQVTGKSYGEVGSRQVLQPLHMRSTGQARNDKMLDKRANGYEAAIDGFRPAAPIHKPLFAAGSMYTAVDDLVLFDRSLYGDDLVSSISKATLFELRDGAVDDTFAYGWSVGESTLDGAIESKRYIATNGEINGFNAIMVRLPEDGHLIILLNNTGETELSAMAANLMRVLYGLAPKSPEPRLRDAFYAMMQNESLDAAILYYRDRRAEQSPNYIYFPWPLRILARQLMTDGRYEDAISILELNLETNPDDTRSYEALAEAHLRAGNVAKATENFTHALSRDGSNAYAADMLRKLGE